MGMVPECFSKQIQAKWDNIIFNAEIAMVRTLRKYWVYVHNTLHCPIDKNVYDISIKAKTKKYNFQFGKNMLARELASIEIHPNRRFKNRRRQFDLNEQTSIVTNLSKKDLSQNELMVLNFGLDFSVQESEFNRLRLINSIQRFTNVAFPEENVRSRCTSSMLLRKEHYCRPCGDKRCKTCPDINETKVFKSTKSNSLYTVSGKLNCKSRNVVYLLTCNECARQYVG
ncbi:hypothetical protein GJ496_006853 [Pomphorhynchus laevis]|nr:hypothetical protein GJ496_006853 [Pomphorhynchus laevis]